MASVVLPLKIYSCSIGHYEEYHTKTEPLFGTEHQFFLAWIAQDFKSIPLRFHVDMIISFTLNLETGEAIEVQQTIESFALSHALTHVGSRP